MTMMMNKFRVIIPFQNIHCFKHYTVSMSITVKLKGEKNKKAFGWYMLALEEASLVKVENVIIG